LEVVDLADTRRRRDRENSRCLSNRASVHVATDKEIFDIDVCSGADLVQVIQHIVDEGLIRDRNATLRTVEIEHEIALEHCHVIVVVVADRYKG